MRFCPNCRKSGLDSRKRALGATNANAKLKTRDSIVEPGLQQLEAGLQNHG
jgi:hypothetical protein